MYILEGTIGAGKSTFLKLISNYLAEAHVVMEPVNQWQKTTTGESILTYFYSDPHRWAYTMEMLTMRSRLQEYLKQQQSPELVIMERSFYSGCYVFAYNCYLSGYLTELEWKLYLEWLTFLTVNTCKTPRGFIYLSVTPEVAYERIKKRNRNGEDSMPLEYIQAINKRYIDFLFNKNSIVPELKDIPVLVLTCDEEFETNSKLMHTHAQAVIEFIKQTNTYPKIKHQTAFESCTF